MLALLASFKRAAAAVWRQLGTGRLAAAGLGQTWKEKASGWQLLNWEQKEDNSCLLWKERGKELRQP
ncbi:hypothetical protein ACOSP7_004706 [Xanthoceras sorbifolium]